MSPILGSYGALTEAAESLVAQLHKQGKLTTPRRENQQIRHKIKILKQTNILRMCTNFRSIEWHQNTYLKISWDYPFKMKYYL
jgi:hypothetical protein